MSKGNNSFIAWAVFPSGSANYISNATALVSLLSFMKQRICVHIFAIFCLTILFCLQRIISRLAEHRVHIPDTFGNYKLLQWNIEPKVKRYTTVSLCGILLLYFTSKLSFNILA